MSTLSELRMPFRWAIDMMVSIESGVGESLDARSVGVETVCTAVECATVRKGDAAGF